MDCACHLAAICGFPELQANFSRKQDTTGGRGKREPRVSPYTQIPFMYGLGHLNGRAAVENDHERYAPPTDHGHAEAGPNPDISRAVEAQEARVPQGVHILLEGRLAPGVVVGRRREERELDEHESCAHP